MRHEQSAAPRRTKIRSRTHGVALVAAFALGALALGNHAMSERLPRAGLPHANGKSFPSLDAYLAHLKALSTIDVPHYNEVAPGVYEQQVQFRLPGTRPRQWTRAELATKYGFPPPR